MDRKRAAVAATSLAVIAGATIIGMEIGSGAPPAAVTRGVVRPAAVPPIQSLPPAVVVARRPTLSEILDIVLRDRPTAAQLASGSGSRGGFPLGSDEGHVSQILRAYTRDGARADRIAAALVKEARRRKVGSSLLVGVLLTENPWLDPRATSFVGARGLMQVMPFHAGKWGCPSSDLFDIESNICHGVAILADNLSQSRTLPQALLGYNGCVRGTNTPDCRRYPVAVYRHARKGSDSEGKTGRPFAAPARRWTLPN
ncbi:MAG: lytic transglycosylase domain-containing protein [Gemmatimonadaceae bacterium]|nr:lytic transglycosylase domain-containing protein [Gemmatimonadaceae bacterium]